MGKVTWRVMGGLAAVLAGVAVRRALMGGWKLVTGNAPPANPENPSTAWREAAGWAIASGVAVGLARLLAARKAAEYYRRSTGHLPPGMHEVTLVAQSAS